MSEYTNPVFRDPDDVDLTPEMAQAALDRFFEVGPERERQLDKVLKPSNDGNYRVPHATLDYGSDFYDHANYQIFSEKYPWLTYCYLDPDKFDYEAKQDKDKPTWYEFLAGIPEDQWQEFLEDIESVRNDPCGFAGDDAWELEQKEVDRYWKEDAHWDLLNDICAKLTNSFHQYVVRRMTPDETWELARAAEIYPESQGEGSVYVKTEDIAAEFDFDLWAGAHDIKQYETDWVNEKRRAWSLDHRGIFEKALTHAVAGDEQKQALLHDASDSDLFRLMVSVVPDQFGISEDLCWRFWGWQTEEKNRWYVGRVPVKSIESPATAIEFGMAVAAQRAAERMVGTALRLPPLDHPELQFEAKKASQSFDDEEDWDIQKAQDWIAMGGYDSAKQIYRDEHVRIIIPITFSTLKKYVLSAAPRPNYSHQQRTSRQEMDALRGDGEVFVVIPHNSQQPTDYGIGPYMVQEKDGELKTEWSRYSFAQQLENKQEGASVRKAFLQWYRKKIRYDFEKYFPYLMQLGGFKAIQRHLHKLDDIETSRALDFKIGFAAAKAGNLVLAAKYLQYDANLLTPAGFYALYDDWGDLTDLFDREYKGTAEKVFSNDMDWLSQYVWDQDFAIDGLTKELSEHHYTQMRETMLWRQVPAPDDVEGDYVALTREMLDVLTDEDIRKYVEDTDLEDFEPYREAIERGVKDAYQSALEAKWIEAYEEAVTERLGQSSWRKYQGKDKLAFLITWAKAQECLDTYNDEHSYEFEDSLHDLLDYAGTPSVQNEYDANYDDNEEYLDEQISNHLSEVEGMDYPEDPRQLQLDIYAPSSVKKVPVRFYSAHYPEGYAAHVSQVEYERLQQTEPWRLNKEAYDAYTAQQAAQPTGAPPAPGLGESVEFFWATVHDHDSGDVLKFDASPYFKVAPLHIIRELEEVGWKGHRADAVAQYAAHTNKTLDNFIEVCNYAYSVEMDAREATRAYNQRLADEGMSLVPFSELEEAADPDNINPQHYLNAVRYVVRLEHIEFPNSEYFPTKWLNMSGYTRSQEVFMTYPEALAAVEAYEKINLRPAYSCHIEPCPEDAFGNVLEAADPDEFDPKQVVLDTDYVWGVAAIWPDGHEQYMQKHLGGGTYAFTGHEPLAAKLTPAAAKEIADELQRCVVKNDIVYKPVVLSEGNAYKYGCVMVNLPEGHAGFVIQWGQANIPDDLIWNENEDGGREKDIHVTAKYGFVGNPIEQLHDIGDNTAPFPVYIGKVSLFQQADHDVVKLDVESPWLHKLNAALSRLPNKDKYPVYKPHITVAYVQKGSCDHLVGADLFAAEGSPGAEFIATNMDYQGATEDSDDPNRPHAHILFSKPKLEEAMPDVRPLYNILSVRLTELFQQHAKRIEPRGPHYRVEYGALNVDAFKKAVESDEVLAPYVGILPVDGLAGGSRGHYSAKLRRVVLYVSPHMGTATMLSILAHELVHMSQHQKTGWSKRPALSYSKRTKAAYRSKEFRETGHFSKAGADSYYSEPVENAAHAGAAAAQLRGDPKWKEKLRSGAKGEAPVYWDWAQEPHPQGYTHYYQKPKAGHRRMLKNLYQAMTQESADPADPDEVDPLDYAGTTLVLASLRKLGFQWSAHSESWQRMRSDNTRINVQPAPGGFSVWFDHSFGNTDPVLWSAEQVMKKLPVWGVNLRESADPDDPASFLPRMTGRWTVAIKGGDFDWADFDSADEAHDYMAERGIRPDEYTVTMSGTRYQHRSLPARLPEAADPDDPQRYIDAMPDSMEQVLRWAGFVQTLPTRWAREYSVRGKVRYASVIYRNDVQDWGMVAYDARPGSGVVSKAFEVSGEGPVRHALTRVPEAPVQEAADPDDFDLEKHYIKKFPTYSFQAHPHWGLMVFRSIDMRDPWPSPIGYLKEIGDGWFVTEINDKQGNPAILLSDADPVLHRRFDTKEIAAQAIDDWRVANLRPRRQRHVEEAADPDDIDPQQYLATTNLPVYYELYMDMPQIGTRLWFNTVGSPSSKPERLIYAEALHLQKYLQPDYAVPLVLKPSENQSQMYWQGRRWPEDFYEEGGVWRNKPQVQESADPDDPQRYIDAEAVTCYVLKSEYKTYYDGTGWSRDIHRAVPYFLGAANAKKEELLADVARLTGRPVPENWCSIVPIEPERELADKKRRAQSRYGYRAFRRTFRESADPDLPASNWDSHIQRHFIIKGGNESTQRHGFYHAAVRPYPLRGPTSIAGGIWSNREYASMWFDEQLAEQMAVELRELGHEAVVEPVVSGVRESADPDATDPVKYLHQMGADWRNVLGARGFTNSAESMLYKHGDLNISVSAKGRGYHIQVYEDTGDSYRGVWAYDAPDFDNMLHFVERWMQRLSESADPDAPERYVRDQEKRFAVYIERPGGNVYASSDGSLSDAPVFMPLAQAVRWMTMATKAGNTPVKLLPESRQQEGEQPFEGLPFPVEPGQLNRFLRGSARRPQRVIL